VPPYSRVVDESAWTKGWNSFAWFSFEMPMPVSVTRNSTHLRPSRSTGATCSVTLPCLVNLHALLSRLNRICRSRVRSACTMQSSCTASYVFLFFSASG